MFSVHLPIDGSWICLVPFLLWCYQTLIGKAIKQHHYLFHFPISSPFPLSRKLKKVSIYSPYTTSFMRCSLAISDIINLCLLLWPPLFWLYVAQKERSRKMKGNMLSGGPKHSKKFNHFLKKNWVACFNFFYLVWTV